MEYQCQYALQVEHHTGHAAVPAEVKTLSGIYYRVIQEAQDREHGCQPQNKLEAAAVAVIRDTSEGDPRDLGNLVYEAGVMESHAPAVGMHWAGIVTAMMAPTTQMPRPEWLIVP